MKFNETANREQKSFLYNMTTWLLIKILDSFQMCSFFCACWDYRHMWRFWSSFYIDMVLHHCAYSYVRYSYLSVQISSGKYYKNTAVHQCVGVDVAVTIAHYWTIDHILYMHISQSLHDLHACETLIEIWAWTVLDKKGTIASF